MQLRLATIFALIASLVAPATAAATITFTPATMPNVTRLVAPTATSGTAVVWDVPTATSTVPGSTTSVFCTPFLGSVFALGDTIVTCSATATTPALPGCAVIPPFICIPTMVDGPTNLTFTVTVAKDTAGPTFESAAPVTAIATSAAGAAVTFPLPGATDPSGVADASRTCAPASGSTFAIGSTTVTCTAADAWGTAATTSFTISVTSPAATSTGSDIVTGFAAADTLRGGAGDDVVRGLDGDDRLFGDAGDDHLIGGRGNDSLSGGAGYDLLVGGPGRDVLVGGLGSDILLGGMGNDSVSARGGGLDVVDCGVGLRDLATVDRVDLVRNCETVRRA